MSGNDTVVRAYERHVFMCTGPVCTKDGVLAEAMFGILGQELDARIYLRIKRTRTHCMVACQAKAPVLVVYPEGTWYRAPDATAVMRIVREHLEGGREVAELVLSRLKESAGAP